MILQLLLIDFYFIFRGSLKANFTVLVRGNEAGRKEFSNAVYRLSQGSVLDIFNQTTTVQSLSLAGTQSRSSAILSLFPISRKFKIKVLL